MTENNNADTREEKDDGANKGAKAPAPSSQDNDDVSEAPPDREGDTEQ